LNQKQDNVPRLLNTAVDINNIDIIRFLLEKGARLNTKDINGMTPLILASYKGYFDIAKLLLDNGARLHSNDNRGFTAMDYAERNKDYGMIELLKSRKNK
ncbi:MAG: ankyrin repeat domain-containing protein, partial [Endomicrobiia bacterium]